MGKKNQIDRAIDQLEAERAVLDAAIAKLKQQQATAPKRRSTAQGGPGETALRQG